MRLRCSLFAGLWLTPVAALAGPPFDTDDPVPTDISHWEIYAGNTFDWVGSTFDGEAALEVNYGPVADVQLSLGLPYAYVHAPASGTHGGAGDLKLSVKYRFVHVKRSGWSVAAFPGVTLPTGSSDFTNRRPTVTLPVWAQLDTGRWTLFGGGGYVIDPGGGNRNHWKAGVAAIRAFGDRLSVGGEITRVGRAAIDGRATTGLGLGAIYQLKSPYSLLLRGGPVFEDGAAKASYHSYIALGLNF